MHWHHIVEQSQISQFGKERIHSLDNIVAIPREVHERLTSFYSSEKPISEPDIVRVWLRSRTFEEQYEFGMNLIRQYLDY